MVFTDMPHGETVSDLKRRVDMLESLVMSLSDQVRYLRGGEMIPTPDLLSASQAPPALIVVPPDPDWIPILHRMERADPSFPRPCGQVGLYLTEPPTQHRNASMEVMRVLVPGEDRWRPPTRLDAPVCSSCGVYVDMFSNSDLDYLSHMLPSVPPPPLSTHPRRARRKPEVEHPAPVSIPQGRHGQASDLPPAFPAHTPEARHADDETLDHLQGLARGLGLPG